MQCNLVPVYFAPRFCYTAFVELKDEFTSGSLDRNRWLPHYLPAWSSRDATRAEYELTAEGLRLFIPNEKGLWCPDLHPEPIRVSGIQSGNHSGPVGSSRGQQRFRDDLVVSEFQPHFEGWLQSGGRLAIRCKMELSTRSMAALWLSGFEQNPDDAGELCVVEIFGRSVRDDTSVEVGVGVKKLFDPRLTQDFAAPRIGIDIGEFHTYAVEWGDGRSLFSVDDRPVLESLQAPDYPLQIMIAVFDFPDWNDGSSRDHVPEMVIDWIEGRSE